MKKIFAGIFLFLSAVFLVAEPPFPRPEHQHFEKPYRNFHGKRFTEYEGDFKPIIIKSMENPDTYILEVLFNGPVDPESVKPECIKINGDPVSIIHLRYSKRRNAFRLIIPKDLFEIKENTFTLNLSDLKSITGNIMAPVEFENCVILSEYRFSEREKVWRKF